MGSCRHHFRAEFYGFSWVPLMFTQSLWLEISFPLLSHSSPSPFFLHLVSSVGGPLVPSQPLGCQPPAGPTCPLPLTQPAAHSVLSPRRPWSFSGPRRGDGGFGPRTVPCSCCCSSWAVSTQTQQAALSPPTCALGLTLISPALTAQCCQHANFQDRQICPTTGVLEC